MECKSNNPAFTRPSWPEWFMNHAILAAQRSSCLKMQTGAVLVKDNKYIVATGYNGVTGGSQHCCDKWQEVYTNEYATTYTTIDDYVQSKEFRTAHHEWAIENELHGEQNCLFMAGRGATPTEGCSMYTVYSPCINCAKAIVMAGIVKVYYRILYTSDQRGVEFLKRCGIECINI